MRPESKEFLKHILENVIHDEVSQIFELSPDEVAFTFENVNEIIQSLKIDLDLNNQIKGNKYYSYFKKNNLDLYDYIEHCQSNLEQARKEYDYIYSLVRKKI